MQETIQYLLVISSNLLKHKPTLTEFQTQSGLKNKYINNKQHSIPIAIGISTLRETKLMRNLYYLLLISILTLASCKTQQITTPQEQQSKLDITQMQGGMWVPQN